MFPLAEVGEACHAGGAGGGGGGRQAWASNAAPNTLGEAAAQATSERTWEAEGLATRAQTRLLLRSAQVRGGEGRPPGCGGRQAAVGRGQKQDFHLAARVLRLWCGLAKNERLIPETYAAPALVKSKPLMPPVAPPRVNGPPIALAQLLAAPGCKLDAPAATRVTSHRSKSSKFCVGCDEELHSQPVDHPEQAAECVSARNLPESIC